MTSAPAKSPSYSLKAFFSPELVRRLAGDVKRVHPGFADRAFVRQACAGLEELELVARGRHIAQALAAHLPAAYPEAIAILLRSLGPPHATDELKGAGMAPFFYFPHLVIVAERGLDHFDLSMRAQHELTRRFSAEFSIRAFLDKDPERTMAVLEAWTADPDAHVRRLASEGTRLRLPWGRRVAWLDAHPERVVALLERLKDDPSSMVRRSVANSLNDIGKAHAALLVRTCEAWLAGAGGERRALVEHALRSAVKRGDPGALRLLGFGRAARVAVEDVRFTPARVEIGGRVEMGFRLRNRRPQAQELLVDVAVHFVKARGSAAPKVFKVACCRLPPRGAAPLKVSFSLAVHTTRVPRPGTHVVDVLVNGHPHRAGSFEVVRPRPRR
jgi:3-methyladenine DNA glycosylase AlkC